MSLSQKTGVETRKQTPRDYKAMHFGFDEAQEGADLVVVGEDSEVADRGPDIRPAQQTDHDQLCASSYDGDSSDVDDGNGGRLQAADDEIRELKAKLAAARAEHALQQKRRTIQGLRQQLEELHLQKRPGSKEKVNSGGARVGTHWVFTIASMLRTGKSTYIGSPHFLDYNEIEILNNLPSPRLFASHMTFDRLPRQVREGKGKVFVVSRNPKDVAVSLYTFLTKLTNPDFSGTWEGFLRFYMEGKMVYGSWFDTLFDWEKVEATYKGDNIMFLVYEEMKQDLLSNVKKMASFLGKTYDQSFLEEVTDRCTFKTMVKTIMDEIKPQDQEFIQKMTVENKLPIYRKGEIGDWKNHFTVAQNEAFDKLYDEKMRDSKCKFRFE